MSFNRKTLLDLHLIVGSFIIPVCLLFAITGSLYTFGIKGSYETKTETVLLTEALSADLDQLQAVAEKILMERNINFPSGESSLKKSGTSWQFEWTGSKMDFLLDPTINPLEYKLSFKETSWHRYFVQLHKAKGGLAFKILAGFLGFGLVLLLGTGWFMASNNSRLKKVRDIAFFSGVFVFVAVALFS